MRRASPERRTQLLRRDLNDLVRNADGRVSEAKTWAVIGKACAVWLLLHHTEYIVDRADALAVLLSIVILPDVFKKIIDAKYGVHK